MVDGGCSQRIIHYFFFLPQYFLSLICLLFFKLDPEPRPLPSLELRGGEASSSCRLRWSPAYRWRGWEFGGARELRWGCGGWK